MNAKAIFAGEQLQYWCSNLSGLAAAGSFKSAATVFAIGLVLCSGAITFLIIHDTASTPGANRLITMDRKMMNTPREQTVQNIYQMYEANGNKAGFYVRRDSWSTVYASADENVGD